MPTLYKLGISGFTPSEETLVQTLLQLTAHHRSVRWSCTGQAPWDALLLDDPDDDRLDHDIPAPLLSQAQRAIPYVLRLTRAGSAPRPGTMQRPIRAEKLLAWLDQVAAKIDDVSRAGAPGPQDPHPPTSPMAHALSAEAMRWRLLGLPPARTVRNDVERRRMATLLNRHALSAQDLHRLTGVDPVECLVFLKLLDAHGLLSTRTGDATPTAPAPGQPATHKLARRVAQGAFARQRD